MDKADLIARIRADVPNLNIDAALGEKEEEVTEDQVFLQIQDLITKLSPERVVLLIKKIVSSFSGGR